MERILKKFASDDAGNATVDWLVLTAGLLFLGIAVALSVSGSTTAVASSSTDAIDNIEPDEIIAKIAS